MQVIWEIFKPYWDWWKESWTLGFWFLVIFLPALIAYYVGRFLYRKTEKQTLLVKGLIMGAIALLLLFCVTLVFLSSQGKKETAQVDKPTRAGAITFATKYFDLLKRYEYSEAYDLIAPENKEKISREEFERRQQENPFYSFSVGVERVEESEKDKANLYFLKLWTPEIYQRLSSKATLRDASIEVKGNQATVTMVVRTSGYKITIQSHLVFRSGKWYQKLDI